MVRARAAEVRTTIDEGRLSYERIMASLPMDDDISTERVGAGGVPAEWIVSPEAQNGRVMLYLHGGGYTSGSMRTHRVMLSHISRASQARVLGLDYRLAPECPFPAPVEDSIAAYRWLLSNGAKPEQIVIGGDSAGGGLMVAALVSLRYLGEPMPAAGVGISSWTDMEATGQSFIDNAEVDPSVNRDRILNIANVYMAGKDLKAPLASPIHADLTGLPPLLLQVGSIETLLDDTHELAKRARAAGVEVEVDVWDDMPHVWQAFASFLPEAREALDHCGQFVQKHTV
jgi:acetyl esterase/lipase